MAGKHNTGPGTGRTDLHGGEAVNATAATADTSLPTRGQVDDMIAAGVAEGVGAGASALQTGNGPWWPNLAQAGVDPDVCQSSFALASGRLVALCYTCVQDITVANLFAHTSSSVSTVPNTTLAKLALGTVGTDAAFHDVTVLAKTANLTDLFTVGSSLRTAALAAHTITRGARIAVCALWVGASTPPALRSTVAVNAGLISAGAFAPAWLAAGPIAGGYLDGQTDIPNTFTLTLNSLDRKPLLGVSV